VESIYGTFGIVTWRTSSAAVLARAASNVSTPSTAPKSSMETASVVQEDAATRTSPRRRAVTLTGPRARLRNRNAIFS